jgi:hypothetical protein
MYELELCVYIAQSKRMQVLNCTLTDAHYSRAYLSCYVLQDYKFFCDCERCKRAQLVQLQYCDIRVHS